MRVGRRRTKNLGCPAGVRPRGGTWYWAPTGAKERRARAERGEQVEITLGPAGSEQARKKWAEVSGYRESEAQEGTVGELIDLWERHGLKTMPSGKPRAAGTVRLYKSSLPDVRKRFHAARYGKTEHDASRGKAVGPADIQRFVRTGDTKAMGNVHLAVLNNVFAHAIGEGLTVYNPAAEVVKNFLKGRTRAPAEWEVECLRAVARPLLVLLMDYEAVTGDRISELLALRNADKLAEGIQVTRKGGKVEVWRWSPELVRIAAEATRLPGATPFPASPIFPGRRGKRFGYSGFDTAWQALKRKANAALGSGIVDPDTLEARDGIVIYDLHFHDLRSKTHDDAVDAGREGHEQIGDTKAVATTHYARRPTGKNPLK